MTINFVLLVNKQGQTRLAKYTDQEMSVEEKRALEGEIVRKCLTRSEKQVGLGCGDCGVMMSLKSMHDHRGFVKHPVLLCGTSQLQGHLPAVCFSVFPGGRRRG